MKRKNLQTFKIGDRLPDGYRIIGILGERCLLAENHSPAYLAAYAVYVQDAGKGLLAFVGSYVTFESAVQTLADIFIDRKLLAYELSKATGRDYTVTQLRKGYVQLG